MMPVDFGVFVFPGFAEGCTVMCRWCDQLPGVSMIMWSQAMWVELEMLECGSWPRRIQGLIDDHTPHPNCRCVLPQVDPPAKPSTGNRGDDLP